jgi:hypothetical protein
MYVKTRNGLDQDIFAMVDTWNTAGVTFNAIRMSVTDTNSTNASRLLDLQIGGGSVFHVKKTGEMVIANSAGTSLGGLKRAGNAGEMALTSQILPATGLPAEVFRYYWEGTPGMVSVLRSLGTNRFSLESGADFVFFSQTSRFTFQGLGGATEVTFAGQEGGSSVGRPLNVTNSGVATPAVPMYVTTTSQSLDLFRLRFNTTTLARFDGTGKLFAPAVEATGVANANALRVAGHSLTGSNAEGVIDLATTWNTTGAPTAIRLNVTNTASDAASRLLDLQLGGASRFHVRPDGETVISNAAGTNFGGIKTTTGGTMAATHLTDPNTGTPADVFRWYWETTPAAGAAVLRGMGTNRFSIESAAAIVHIAGNARYEWEGLGSQRLSWNSYEAGSSIHRPIDINLEGTVEEAPALNLPILSLSGKAGRTNDLLALGIWDGNTTWTTYSRFDSTGKLFAPNVESTGNIKGKLTTETNAAAGGITPTHTLTLYDATGTAYKVACVAA